MRITVNAARFVIEQAGVFALAYAVFIEAVVYAVYFLNAGKLNTISIVAIFDPALCNLAIDIIDSVNFAVKFCTAVLTGAIYIAVSGCGNGCAPIYNRLTYITVSSAGVACFAASCCLICNCCCGVDMTAVPCCLISHTFFGLYHELLDSPSLGIAVNLFTSKGLSCAVGQGYSTLLDADFHGDPPVLVLALKPCVGVFVAFFKYTSAANLASNIVQLPNADRDGNQGLLTGQLGLTGLRDGQMQDLIGSIIGVSSRKALGYFHVIQLPLVHAVEVQSRSYRLNIGDVSSNNIHIIERTEENTIQRCIVRNDLHTGLLTRGNIHLANNGGVVALLIADGELDGMLACGENSAAIHSNGAVAVSAGNLVAVHIGLGGRCIDTGSVGLFGVLRHHCGEVNCVVGNGSAICQGSGVGHAVSRIVHAREDWSFTIFHNGGIVHSDIINVDGEVAVDVGVLLGIVVVRRAVTIRDVELHAVIAITPHSTGVLAEIAGQVVPAGLIERVHHTGAASSIIHDIAGDGSAGNIYGSILVDRGNGVQYPAGPKANILVRNVNPHTKALCANQRAVAFLSLHRRTEQCGHHKSGFLRIGVVNIDAQRIVTVVNLTIFRISNKSVAVGQVVIITGVSGLKATGRAVLKVEENLGPLAKRQGCFGSQVGIYKLRSNGGTGHAGRLLACRKAQAADRTGSLILQREGEVIGISHDFIQPVGCIQFQNCGLSVGNRNGIGSKFDCLGNHTVDSNGTNILVAQLRGQNHIAGSGSSQNTVLISTVFNFVCYFCWNLCRSTCRRNTGNGHGGRRTDGQILILGHHADMVKGVGRNCRRCNDDTVGDRALGAVGRTVLNGADVRTLVLCHEGRGTAAVQIEGSHAAGFQHDLSQLMHGTAAGEGLLATVQNADNQLAISGDTNHGARVSVSIIAARNIGGYILTVPNEVGTKNVDCLRNALLLAGIPGFLGVVDDSSAVIQNRKEYRIGVFIPILLDIAAHNEYATGFTGGHVVSVAIASGDNCVVLTDKLFVVGIGVLFVCTGNHVRQLVHAVVFILHILICNLSNYIVSCEVGSSYIVNHLLSIF